MNQADNSREAGGSLPVFVDTHTHLDDPDFDHDRWEVLEGARRVGVARVVNIGYRPSRWRTTAALVEASPRVAAVLGIHPQHADEFTASTLEELERSIASVGACAVGEIGLDYFRYGPSPALQCHAFEQQLLLAERLGLPVVIHQRAAEADCLAVLQGAPSNLRAILHSFEGSEALANLGLENGYFFGVGGLMTRPHSADLRNLLTHLPLDKLVLETDAPYLTPAKIKERRNVPANIPRIAQHLADLMDVDLTTIANMTTANAGVALGLPPLPADAPGSVLQTEEPFGR